MNRIPCTFVLPTYGLEVIRSESVNLIETL